MPALAKDTTLQSILEGLTGGVPSRTAKVTNITFDVSQFEAGKINNTSGNNEGGSGFYRTTGYISLPSGAWKAQLFADKPWAVFILYYDSEKTYTQEYDYTVTGYVRIKNYPYCRLYFFNHNDYLSLDEFVSTSLKIQYILSAPAENEYFLHNHLCNGNFEFDRNDDGIGDGWELQNSPTSALVEDNTQIVTPSTANYFFRYITSDSSLTGHEIYVAFTAYTPNALISMVTMGTTVIAATNTKYTRASVIATAQNTNTNPRFSIASGGQGNPVYIRNVMIIDLTEIFGAGNEPSKQKVEEIIDKFYGGYVPCEYEVKYDDSGLPVNVLAQLENIENEALAVDDVIMSNGVVSAVKRYIGGKLKSTTQINRDMFGNIVSVEEVQE